MNRRPRAASSAAAMALMVVAACSAATPSPPATSLGSTPPGSHIRAPSIGASASPTTSPAPSASPDRSGEDFAGQVEIGMIDPALTHPILEFRSDGESIVYSSARAADSGPEGAPDLWRITPPFDEPELLWRNPERNHSIVMIAGDLGSYAFVDIPLTGERAWNLWFLPRGTSEPILLDTHPGDEDVSSLVPSMAVYETTVVWTAFDRGPSGPVSQLLIAQGPAWEPRLIREVPAAEGELWFPSLLGSTLAYVEVRYFDERSTDERYVYLTDTAPGSEPRRLDRSGRATMPVVVDDAVLWKEAEEGFAMMNWGKMFLYDLADGSVRRLRTAPQQWVNYPSAGYRFATWWGADSFQLGVYDLVRDEPRLLSRRLVASDISDLSPHIAGDLLVWMEAGGPSADEHSVLRYTFLPGPRDP